VLRSKQDWDAGQVPPAIAGAQETIRWAQHLVIIYPLWMGLLLALLKAFFKPKFLVDG